MDFKSDPLFDGHRLRALTVVDALNRESLAIDVNQGIKGELVVEAMARISAARGAPRAIRVDNSPEFISKALNAWTYENGVTLEFSRLRKPADKPLLHRSTVACATNTSTHMDLQQPHHAAGTLVQGPSTP